ncbi:TPA: site-specific DNA-methyltransferase [Streptococcus equi subsp. zooepidemicus]|uniref:Methyltransferase n=1 Tax=Streptococcus equi subsp. zooepidemicus TaxID=40041 RepID=A0AAX2LMF3_STRSZ|nr:site-specific DNA-methyltransferase [Streptococcus equi]HER9225355.1 site-specific DNA-methyltransferase [Streptococcus pyogenes]MCD3397120.1 site-specific DNA-methyltransferase [Streptococcus equi subsp. zooepidemicus]MCD3427221.1 site-specific DNA-methyltransferase [Streptococcus equi subsp. zooepidemicus]MCD3436079.1 site-specific DNA-methyltransferase [Streptococcus equi subsp. zooepidemicus]MCD3438002.1 site-specific DNA-methyltransferase [Streptococcus equi subsp. zooepidemicus]
MQIETLLLSDITPYNYNAKKHPQYQIDQIKESIKTFGNNDPIAIDENNVIIEGHGRYLALKALGYNQVPVIRLKHLSDDQKRAYILAHNKITLNTDFDMTLLKQELTSIMAIDMAQFGFSVNLLAASLKGDGEHDFTEDPDSVMEKIGIGSLYQLGRHRLMCGDATKPEHLNRLLEGTKADLYLTDPPYNVAYQGKTSEALTIQNDQIASSDFQAFLTDSFQVVDSHLKAGAAFYIWHADSERLSFSNAISAVGWLEKQCLIWSKDSFVLGRQDYQWQHEPCLYGWKPGAKHYFVSDFSLSTVLASSLEDKSKEELIDLIRAYQEVQPTSILRIKRPQANQDHPTMKPLALIERLVRNSSRQGEVVLDSFAGSGTTLMVCEQLNRINYSMELDPKYVQRILKRFERETGISPKQIR